MTNQTRKAVNQWVEAVYVLSVKSFDSRIHHIKQELEKYNITFEFMFEHDANELTNDTIENTFSQSNLKNTHQSLVLKNIAVWHKAASKNYSKILVLEDDAILFDDFIDRFDEAMTATEKLKDGWLVFLGGSDVKVPDFYFLEPGPLIALPMSTAEGYVSDLCSIQRRLTWLENNKVTLPADHLIRHIDQESNTPHYWLTRAIVKQGSTTGLFDSMLDDHRQKHSRLFTIARNNWNKFRRQQLRRYIVRLKASLLKNISSN